MKKFLIIIFLLCIALVSASIKDIVFSLDKENYNENIDIDLVKEKDNLTLYSSDQDITSFTGYTIDKNNIEKYDISVQTDINKEINIAIRNNSIPQNNTENIYSCTTIESPGIYYLQNNIIDSTIEHCVDIQANNVVLDCQGYVIGGAGLLSQVGIYILRIPPESTNIVIKNCIILDWNNGIELDGASNNTIENVTLINIKPGGGILLAGSDESNIIKNSFFINTFKGIYLNFGANDTIIQDNIFLNNFHAIYQVGGPKYHTILSNSFLGNSFGLESGCKGLVSTNLFKGNRKDLQYTNQQVFENNLFLDNSLSKMIEVDFNDRSFDLNDVLKFNISVYNPNGTECTSFTYELFSKPEEIISSSLNQNMIIGNFNVSKNGLYSLIINIVGCNNNTIERKYTFFVNSNQIKTTNYYLRPDVKPIHGQPAWKDAGSLIFEQPTTESNFTCSIWIQASPDNLESSIPYYLQNISISSWYKTNDAIDPLVGIQRYLTFDQINMDDSKTVPIALNWTWFTINFTNLNWPIDYLTDWYWLAIKLVGDDPYWYTNQTQPSYVNISYLYTDTPEIKSLSNTDVEILSATMAPNSNNALVQLKGQGSTNMTVVMPNQNLIYYAIYDGVYCNNDECTFTQNNGELVFNLVLDFEHNLRIKRRTLISEPILNNATIIDFIFWPRISTLRLLRNFE